MVSSIKIAVMTHMTMNAVLSSSKYLTSPKPALLFCVMAESILFFSSKRVSISSEQSNILFFSA